MFTKPQLLALPPGPELDREVWILLGSDYARDHAEHNLPISTDANIAIHVWQERFGKCEWDLSYDHESKEWFVSPWNRPTMTISHAPTVAHAICKAFIKKLMEGGRLRD